MRNVYLSFLGTNDYLHCNYHADGAGTVENVRFVQEATLKMFARDWSADDRVFIFTTEEAHARNWLDDGQARRLREKGVCEGLESRIQRLAPAPKVENVMIPKGESEDEIWQIFEMVFRRFEPEDAVVFDITHAFRSIPLLATVVLNYAKVLKNIELKGIYYGAFEVLGTISQAKALSVSDRNAPIFDLTPFDTLLAWSSAIDGFLKSGDASSVHRLAEQSLAPVMRDQKEMRQAGKLLRNLARNLSDWGRTVATCRFRDITPSMTRIRENLAACQELDLLPPFKPLLEKVLPETERFVGAEIQDGVHAARWCLNHNLVQQGYTILQETMIGFFVDALGRPILDQTAREIVSSAFAIERKNLPEAEWKNSAADHPELTRQAVEMIRRTGLGDRLAGMAGERNDLNHAGCRENAAKPTTFLKNLEIYLNAVEAAVGQTRPPQPEPATKADRKTLFLVFNHTFTAAQEKDARESLDVAEVTPLPDDLREVWGQIPPDLPEIEPYLAPIRNWLAAEGRAGDHVLIQGDFGACHLLVAWAVENRFVPVYATTRREAVETQEPDGSVKMTHHFKHQMFRRYGR